MQLTDQTIIVVPAKEGQPPYWEGTLAELRGNQIANGRMPNSLAYIFGDLRAGVREDGRFGMLHYRGGWPVTIKDLAGETPTDIHVSWLT